MVNLNFVPISGLITMSSFKCEQYHYEMAASYSGYLTSNGGADDYDGVDILHPSHLAWCSDIFTLILSFLSLSNIIHYF